VSEIIARTAIELQLRASLAGNDAKAVMLDFMQPLAACGQLIGLVGRHGEMTSSPPPIQHFDE
jgi:hypothetical protein